jgi:phenylalanyl-tRNA synthetase beta chain
MPPVFAALADGSCAGLSINNQRAGYLALVRDDVAAKYDADAPVAVAEINLPILLDLFPPRARVAALPTFPAVDRDLSLVMDDALPWSRVAALVESLRLSRLESLDFVGAYRGKQVGAGRKSVTLRLTFRDPERTLRREEVEPQVERVVAAARQDLGAELRA